MNVMTEPKKRRAFPGWILTPIALAASFPPMPLGMLSCVAFVPFFRAVEHRPPKAAFGLGYFTGFLFSVATLYWIAWPTVPGFVGAMLYLPFFFALFGALLAWLAASWGGLAVAFAPFLWTGLEYLSSLGVLAFPWNSLANTFTVASRLRPPSCSRSSMAIE